MLSVLTLVVAALVPAGAAAQATWDGSTSSDWFDPSNWVGNAVPGTFLEVIINTAGTNPAVIDGATATNATVFVGNGVAAQGTLTIQNGGVLDPYEMYIGYTAGAVGVVNVDGAGSELTLGSQNLYVGYLGTGTLSVTNGGHVDAYHAVVGDLAGSQGTVVVDGEGSFWYTHGGLSVGRGGSGSVTISGGGDAESSSTEIGLNALGTVTVTGTGSTWTVGSSGATSVKVGVDAEGWLTITESGLVTTIADVEVGGAVGAGTLAMDPSGRLVVGGDAAFGANATFVVAVTPASIPSGAMVDVTGVVTIDPAAMVEVTANDGDYAPNTVYTLITADGGVNGVFGGVSSHLAYLDAALSYDPNNVYLALTRNDLGFAVFAETPNQIATADAVEAQGAGDQVYDAVVGLSAAEAPAAFDALSGEGHASIKGLVADNSRLVRDVVLGHLDAALAAPGETGALGYADDPTLSPTSAYAGGVWGQLYGGFDRLASDGNAAAASSAAGGVVLGAEGAFDQTRLGVVAHAGVTNVDIPDRATTGSSADYGIGVYGGTRLGDTGLAFGAAYTRHAISTMRQVDFSGFTDTLAAEYGAGTGQVFGELTHELDFGAFALTPFGQLAYVSHATDAFTETGGAAALTSAANTFDATFATVGLRGSHQMLLEGGGLLSVTGALGWRHAFAELPTAENAFAGGDVFTVSGDPIAEDALVIEAGLDVDLGAGLDFTLSYDGQLAAGGEAHAVRAGIGGTF